MATQTEAAEHIDVADRTFRRLQKEGILPPNKGRGGYDLEACRVAYIRHLRGVASGQHAADPETLDLTMERARKERAMADKTEFDLSILKKEYVHISHVERILERFAAQAAAAFDAVAAKIKNRLPHLSQRDIDVVKKELAGTRNAVAELRPASNARAKRKA